MFEWHFSTFFEKIWSIISVSDILIFLRQLLSLAKLDAGFSIIYLRFDINSRKTTQIPQFLIESDPDVKVVVCQPRRLAAIGVATRVAWEQNSPVGEVTDSSIHCLTFRRSLGILLKDWAEPRRKHDFYFAHMESCWGDSKLISYWVAWIMSFLMRLSNSFCW